MENRITALKQGVKNPERVNVFVDDKFAFSLDVAQVVDLKIKIGRKISDEELAEFKKASEFGKMYQRTLEWVLVRPRSERETKDYLYRKFHKSSLEVLSATYRHKRAGAALAPSATYRHKRAGAALAPVAAKDTSEDRAKLAASIIERLKARGYLDDVRFAKWYAENRFVKKGISLKRLKMELTKKGVSKEIIEEVLAESERDDTEEIKKMILKKRARYQDDQKLTAYLVRQGFDYALVKELVSETADDFGG